MRYLLLLMVFILPTCSSYDLGKEPPTTIAVNSTNPTWENGMHDLINAKCAFCHRPASLRSPFVPSHTPSTMDDISQENFFVSSNSARIQKVYTSVFNNKTVPMPPAYATPLGTLEKEALQKFLTPLLGTLATICGTTGSSTKTYSTMAATVNGDCAKSGCHSGSTPPDLRSLDLIKTNRINSLAQLNGKTMPKDKASGYLSTTAGQDLFNWLCFGSDLN